jgi:hypothetical protein
MKSLVFVLLVLASSAFGQTSNSLVASYALFDRAPAPATNPFDHLAAAEAPLPGDKSPFLAAVLSLAIPGAGEYYVGDKNWWRGLIFSGLEAGLWLEYAHWTSRGDDSTTAFYAYSDAHFSVPRYATYMDTLLSTDSIKRVIDPSNPAEVNGAEESLDSLALTHANIQNFTHRLAFNDRQQYYEMISKYLQFIPGWDTRENWNSASEMRNRMNDQYGTATYFLWGVIANHILSAVDAALVAHDHNSQLRLHGDIIRKAFPNGALGYVPTANIEYRF